MEDRCRTDPLYWLTHHTRTRDDHWREKGTEPYARFPNKPYMPFLFWRLQNSANLLIAKSREMLLTWAVIGFLTWKAQYHGPVHLMIQTQKEEKARDLVSGLDVPGYVRTLYEQQDPWMRAMHPTPRPPSEMAGLVFTWRNGSKIQGIPSGSEQIRQFHPDTIFFDEAAFLDDWEGSYGAAQPVANHIISVSSAAPSDFMDLATSVLEG